MTQRRLVLVPGEAIDKLYAFCGADGVLFFGPFITPGSLPVAAPCPDVQRADEWKSIIEGLCRRGWQGSYLVPGIPEAEDQHAGLVAFNAFRDRLQPIIDKAFKV